MYHTMENDSVHGPHVRTCSTEQKYKFSYN